MTVNCGRVEGGGAVNIVPDLAIGRFNIRVTRADEQQEIEKANSCASRPGDFTTRRDQCDGPWQIHLTAQTARSRDRLAKLSELVQSCGEQLGLNLEVHPERRGLRRQPPRRSRASRRRYPRLLVQVRRASAQRPGIHPDRQPRGTSEADGIGAHGITAKGQSHLKMIGPCDAITLNYGRCVF